MEDLQYQHVESALAEAMKVKRGGLGAFRARLRHLRTIGLPGIPGPGSGRHINYTRPQALELLIALELEKIGQLPRVAAANAKSIVRQSPYGQHKNKDCYVAISKEKEGYTMAFGWSAFSEMLQSAPDVFTVITVINVSACVRRLETAFSRVAGAS